MTNQSRFALGASADNHRVLRVHLATAADSELGDEHVELIAEGKVLPPGAGWTHEIEHLGPGETAAIELTVRIKEGAPGYLRFAATVTLELGALDQPTAARPIQARGFDIRVARAFEVSDADLLLVVNHRTTREEIEAWEQLGERLACKLAIWDLSRERHLDLERPLAGGVALIDWFAHKAIVVLDNEIEGPSGPTYPHVFLDDEQVTRAAAAGLDLALIGRGMKLERLLVPAEERPRDAAASPAESPAALIAAARASARNTTTVYRTYWLRWWAKPSAAWLAKQANKLSARLADAVPEQRHVVIHRFAPALDGEGAFANRWKVGTIETVRTLDTAAGAIVHASIDEATLHDPAYAGSEHATTALLVMFDFAENLARLRAVLARPEVTAAELTPLVDALVLDLANELAAVIAPGWKGDASAHDLEAALPRLEALGGSGLTARYGTPGGDALLRLAGRLRFLADSQLRWWERIPPWRWMRRGPTARARIIRHVDRLLGAAFGEHDLAQTRADALELAGALRAEHAQQRETRLAAKRRVWALELARTPIASRALTSDTELLDTAAARVLSGEEYDQLVADKAEIAAQRAVLVASADQQHADLGVPAAAAREAPSVQSTP